MRAIVVTAPGGPDVLHLGEIPTPVPGQREVRVRVRATALNRMDLLQRQGTYPLPPGTPDTLGVEVAGDIEAVGADVQEWRVGERVCALVLGGGYAEFAVVPAGMAMPIPDNLSFAQAAAIPEVFLTAYLNLFTLGGTKPGEAVLIHAGASGVGTAAIQLAREAGAVPLVTVGSAKKAARCRDLGAVLAWNYLDGPFVQPVRAALQGGQVAVVLDMVGAPYWDQNLEILGTSGRLILIGLQGGSRVQADLAIVQRKRLRVIGTGLRPLSLDEKTALTRDFAAFALPRFKSGALVPVIDSVFDWHEAGRAHAYMASNANIGKIVLQIV